MTPPISGQVATSVGPLGPCIVAALSRSSGTADARQKSFSKGSVPPPAVAHSLFHIRTPSLIVSGRGGAAFCLRVENATTTVAQVFAGRLEFQAPHDAAKRPPVIPLAEGGWVCTDRTPDGKWLVIFGTEKNLPAALARRLPKIESPAYSQGATENPAAGKRAPGS
jgi:hypothetical protein